MIAYRRHVDGVATFPWMGWQTSVADAAETKEGTTAWKATQEGEAWRLGGHTACARVAAEDPPPAGARPHQPRPVERRRTDDGSLNTSYTAAADEAVR